MVMALGWLMRLAARASRLLEALGDAFLPCQVHPQDLDCDLAVNRRLDGLINVAHPTRADSRLDRIPSADGLPDQRGRIRFPLSSFAGHPDAKAILSDFRIRRL